MLGCTNDLQQRTVEIGGVLDRMRILQMRDVIGGDAVVMEALRLGVWRAGVLGKEGKPSLADSIRVAAIGGHQRILVDQKWLAGRGTAKKIEHRLQPFPRLC